MKAPPDVVRWAKAAEGVDVSKVDWTRDDKEETWQAFVDDIAKKDRQAAVEARDHAQKQIVELSRGSFWEGVAWPGHAEAHSSRQVLQTAAGQLPKGEPRVVEWVNAIERVRGTVEAARGLLVKAELPADVVIVDRILENLNAAYARARHAVEAPEIIEGKVPQQPPPAPHTQPPKEEGGSSWWLWAAGAAVLLIAASQEDEAAEDEEDEGP